MFSVKFTLTIVFYPKSNKNSGVKFGTLMRVLADKGYQGIAKIHQLSQTPIKKKKGKKLTKEEKQ